MNISYITVDCINLIATKFEMNGDSGDQITVKRDGVANFCVIYHLECLEASLVAGGEC